MPQDQVRRPEVTLTSSSAPPEPLAVEGPQRPDRRPLALLLLPVVLLALVLGRPSAPDARPPEPEQTPDLVLLEEQLAVTQGGVLVVALELRNPGDALQVRSAVAYAQPVVDDPEVQAPMTVRAGADRRFVALLAPDCRLLQPGSPLRFSASLLLQVGRGSVKQDLVLDLATAPVVRDRVAGLCRTS